MARRLTPGSHEVTLVVDALDEELADEEGAREAVARLGIDVAAMADEIYTRLATYRDAERKARFAAAREAYAREVAELSARQREPVRSRAEQETILLGLMKNAGPEGVAAHYHKYEQATDEELAEMITSLRFLLDKRNGSR